MTRVSELRLSVRISNFSSEQALVSSSFRRATWPRQPPFGVGIALSGGLCIPRAFRLPAFASWPSCARCGFGLLLQAAYWITPDHNGVATFHIGEMHGGELASLRRERGIVSTEPLNTVDLCSSKDVSPTFVP